MNRNGNYAYWRPTDGMLPTGGFGLKLEGQFPLLLGTNQNMKSIYGGNLNCVIHLYFIAFILPTKCW